jgi:hypothetical protein
LVNTSSNTYLNIFSQLDEENNGFIAFEKLLAIIKSIQDAPSSTIQEEAGASPNPSELGISDKVISIDLSELSALLAVS